MFMTYQPKKRQRKKEQKGVLKDEMAERKEKLDKMKQQYEEDKQFAKESGFKFSSKKQKERREEELKAKAQWMQQQQLLQAQETDDKVGKIADNVVNLSDYQDRSISKLDKIENTIRDGINRLADKFDFKPLEEKEESPTVVEPEDITPQQAQSVEGENKPKKPATLKDAFEEFLKEENRAESKEIDELVSYTYGKRIRENEG